MNALKETVKKLLNETESNICTSFMNVDFSPEHSKWDDDDEKEFKSALQSSGLSVTNEDSYGGEGQGEDYWSVYSFTNGTDVVYVKFNGWYASYNGSEFSEWLFVEPKKVEVVKYVAI